MQDHILKGKVIHKDNNKLMCDSRLGRTFFFVLKCSKEILKVTMRVTLSLKVPCDMRISNTSIL